MRLDELLIAAAEAPPESRIDYRDPLAGYGDLSVEALMAPSWIGDPGYAGFAIQTIRKAGELGAPSAADALRQAALIVSTDWHRKDVANALASLGVAWPSTKSSKKPPTRPSAPPIAPDDLVVDRCYRRSDLHNGGLGGNRQKGISYPAQGTYCLLFSDPNKVHDYGYKDQPVGRAGYRYFGEWSGPGDMVMTGGNRAIRERSPELYLFTAAACGYVFRGRQRLVEVEAAKATRDGREFNAIVFVLESLQ
jgi:hypothetical protein